MHTTGVIFLARDRSCIKLQLISREMFRAPSESKRGYTIPPPRAEIRSARLVIDLFDMPVDKRTDSIYTVICPVLSGRNRGGGGEVRRTVISVRLLPRSISRLIGIRLTCLSFVSTDIYLNYRGEPF